MLQQITGMSMGDSKYIRRECTLCIFEVEVTVNQPHYNIVNVITTTKTVRKGDYNFFF